MKLKTTFIKLNDGIEICVPEQIDLMSNFVLQEQGDWFEDEINFVRAFIKPGMQALDIGANYGLYSTAIAKNLQGQGRLWCFEPTQNTADALRQTIAKNQLGESIELIQAGLSDHLGQATLYTSPNAELNSLTANESTSGEQQTIDLLTLDHCLEKYRWQHLEFIKLDAEGEELKIVKQAQRTLSICSPLIMFELKHGPHINTHLISAFQQYGYQPYQLIPGLNILAPFNPAAQIDGFLLNLFCCKDDTAQKLAHEGFLVKQVKPQGPDQGVSINEFLSQFDFAKLLPTQLPIDNAPQRDYQSAMAAYVGSRNPQFTSEQRLAHLAYAFEIVKKMLSAGESRIERLSTFARICFDFGQRSIGLQVLEYLIQKFVHNREPFSIGQEFVPPGREFEAVNPQGRLGDWLCAASIDQYIRKHAFSFYFSTNDTVPLFAELKRLNFQHPDMLKREATFWKLVNQ